MNRLLLDFHLGALELQWNEEALVTGVKFSKFYSSQQKKQSSMVSRSRVPLSILELVEQLRNYFEQGKPIGTLAWHQFDQSGWTDFQKKVYRVASSIPHGETRTYAWIAEKIGKIQASRAVGQALRKNPMVIFVPCHRIVSVHDGLGGFMGKKDPTLPELQMKLRLLKLEEQYRNPVFPFLAGTWDTIALRA